MGMLLYLFCDGKTEDNLLGIFNLFDEDGNGTISIDELLNMMAFFIEIGRIFPLVEELLTTMTMQVLTLARWIWPPSWLRCSKRATRKDDFKTQ